MTKEVMSIRIDEDVMKKARELAKKENRPISNFIETVLLRYFKEIEKENPGE